MSSEKDLILSFQHHHRSLEETLSSVVEPYSISDGRRPSKGDPILLLVYRIISPTRFLLAPLKAYQSCSVKKVFLTESPLKAVNEQFPEAKLQIGSIIEALLLKNECRAEYFSHFVARVEQIWDVPLFPIRSNSNLVQVTLECDLSVKGRCRRDIIGSESYFILECKYGVEASIPAERLPIDFLSDDMTLQGSILVCNMIITGGGPTFFRILDTCRIIKKTAGQPDELIPARRKAQKNEREDHEQ